MRSLTKHPSVAVLLFISSFASFGAVLLTPALPTLARYFRESIPATEAIMTYYLVGYAVGQLIYGPLANALGRKNALLWGTSIALLGSVLAILAPLVHSFTLLVVGRFLVAFGSAAGIVIGMTIIKDTHDEIGARKTFAKVLLAFSLVPFISITLGGSLTHYFGWQSTNIVMVIYAFLLVLTSLFLQETLSKEKRIQLRLATLVESYRTLFSHLEYLKLILIFAACTAENYLFNAFAPVIAIDNLGISTVAYGWLSLVPSSGILMGGWFSSQLANRFDARKMIFLGSIIVLSASALLTLLFGFKIIGVVTFYTLAFAAFCGVAIIIPNASMQALSRISDHANGASVMNATGLISSGILVALLGRLIEHHVIVLSVSLSLLSIISFLLQLSLTQKYKSAINLNIGT